MSTRFVRIREAQQRLGLGRSTIYRLIKQGKLPPLRKIAVGNPNSLQCPSAFDEAEFERAMQKLVVATDSERDKQEAA